MVFKLKKEYISYRTSFAQLLMN